MIGDQLSNQEDRALHRALESVVQTQFPNPRRNECPGANTLRAIATKRIPMRDPAIDHVGHCSPCFSELTDMRRTIHRRNLLWKAGSVAAAVLVLALLVNYLGFRRGDSGTAGPIAQPQHQIAMIDLRNASTARSVQPSVTGAAQPQIEIPRAIVSLTIQLPVGSESGNYEVVIRKPNQSTGAVQGTGSAQIDSGITKLTIDLDTSTLPSGDYDLAWRMADFDWRSYPIRIP
jgi:hypothetical protein